MIASDGNLLFIASLMLVLAEGDEVPVVELQVRPTHGDAVAKEFGKVITGSRSNGCRLWEL